jgi:CDP-glucose 4,6-dehydratase
VLEIVRTIQRMMDRTDLEPEILDSVKAEIRDQYLNSYKARRMLGWSPLHSLEQGLIKTIPWYRSYFSEEQKRAAN